MNNNEEVKQEVEPEITLDEQFKSIFDGIVSLNNGAKDLQLDVKTLHKMCKSACKPKKVKKHTVMHDPMNITEELIKYLKLEKDSKRTKSECMKLVSTRVKEENMQNPENKRQFTPNKKLAKVLNMSPIKTITFVELNKHLAHHFTPC
tara:strand:+ start:61 stop:504 length:444 start_codon:yes stop_codon:yes gene_type:complete